MLATLVPNEVDCIVAGWLEVGERLAISIFQQDPPPIECFYKQPPKSFFNDHCKHCEYFGRFEDWPKVDKMKYFLKDQYEEALKAAEAQVQPEAYNTTKAYEIALEKARQSVIKDEFIDRPSYFEAVSNNELKWRSTRCPGGIAELEAEDCFKFEVEDVQVKGSAVHYTLPHIFQATHWINYKTSSYQIFAFREAVKVNGEEKLEVVPYMLGNVYSNGEICWGDTSKSPHLNVRYNTFWSSYFNRDLIPGDEFPSEWIPTMHLQAEESFSWEVWKVNELLGKPVLTSEGHDGPPIAGVLYLSNEDLIRRDLALNLVPPKNRPNGLFSWIFRKDSGYIAYDSRFDPPLPIDLVRLENQQIELKPYDNNDLLK